MTPATPRREFNSSSPAATEALGEELARSLEPGDLVLLEGELASGKTTLVRGLVRGLNGPADEVSSPTFVLVTSYPCPGPGVRALHHVDLYRVGGSTPALREIGLEELLQQEDAVVAVEWPPDALVDWLPAGARVVRVTLRVVAADRRRITVVLGGGADG